MKAITPSPAGHHSAGEFIYNDNLVVLDHILNIFLKKPVGLDELLGGVYQVGRPDIFAFKLPKLFVLFLVGQLIIFPDTMACIIKINKREVPQTSSGEKINAYFRQFDAVPLFVNGAIELLIQISQDLLGTQHALRPVNLFLQCLIFCYDIQEPSILRISSLDLQERLNRLFVNIFAIQPLSDLFQQRVNDGFLLSPQSNDERLDLIIDLIFALLHGPAYDEGSPGFIDQDAVHFIHDGIKMFPVDALLGIKLHIVAQVVESELIIRAIGNIAFVGLFPLRIIHPVDNDSHTESQGVINYTHPVGIPLCQVIVDRNQVNPPTRQGIQIERECCGKSLSLTGFHFSNFPVVKNHSSDKLCIKVPHA